MKKILIILSLFISSACLSVAIDMVLNGGDKLLLTKWNEMAGVLNKVDVSGNNININGKLVVNGKICAGSDCLGECSGGQVWNTSTNICELPAQTPETAGESCKTILEGGTTVSDYYYIDPDGKGTGTPAVEVWCDMDYDGGGWTRYVNISGNYSFTSAKHCWYNSNGINKNAYGGMTECFNPNRYGMGADKLRLKIGGTNYVKSITNGASVTTNTYSSSGGRYCLGHVNYMTMRDRPSVNYPNADSVWLGASACTPSSTPRQVGGIAGSQYMNTTETSFGPPNAGWSGAADTTTELYIR